MKLNKMIESLKQMIFRKKGNIRFEQHDDKSVYVYGYPALEGRKGYLKSDGMAFFRGPGWGNFDTDLNFVEPFRPINDVSAHLKEIREERRERLAKSTSLFSRLCSGRRRS